jgi:hypothetical protein
MVTTRDPFQDYPRHQVNKPEGAHRQQDADAEAHGLAEPERVFYELGQVNGQGRAKSPDE